MLAYGNLTVYFFWVKIKMDIIHLYLIDTNLPGGFHHIDDVMTAISFTLANWSSPPPSPHTHTHTLSFFNLSPGELNFRVALLKALIKHRQWRSLKTCVVQQLLLSCQLLGGLIQATTSHKRVNSSSQRTLGKHAWPALKQNPGCL